MLIGLGGTGRTTLTTISRFIKKLENYPIEITKGYDEIAWKEDLRKLLKLTGAKSIPTVLMISDNNILSNSALEDINNLICNGEVPNLLQTEDYEEIY